MGKGVRCVVALGYRRRSAAALTVPARDPTAARCRHHEGVNLILCGDQLAIHFTSPAKKKGMLGIPTRHSIPLDTRSSIEWTVSHTFCFRRRVVWKNQKGQQGPSTIHRLGEWGAPIGSLDTRSSVEWTIFNHLWSPGGGVCRRRSNDCDFIPIAAVVVVRQKGASVWQR